MPLAKRLFGLGKDWREADRAILELLPAFQEIAEIPRETWTEASKDWRRLMGVQI